MKDNNDDAATGVKRVHLPYYDALKRYNETRWIVFGTLTHKYDVSPVVQLKRFAALMEQLGALNNAFGNRLHWVVRVEGAHEDGKGGFTVTEKKTHLHFLLAEHKITNGHKKKLTPLQVCAFMKTHWSYGMAKLMEYDDAKDGLGYVLKCNRGSESKEWNDRVVISQALAKLLKRYSAKLSVEQRDAFAVGLFNALRKSGTKVWFGDNVPHWSSV